MAAVPLSHALCLGRRDTPQTERDRHRDALGIERPKGTLFNKLQRDGERDTSETVLSERCLSLFRVVGQCRVRRMGSQ